MLLLIRQLTGQNRSYLPPFPSLSVHPRASHSPCRYRFRQATRGRAREAGRQPAHLGPSKVAPSLILRRPLLFGNPSQDPSISLENTHYTTVNNLEMPIIVLTKLAKLWTRGNASTKNLETILVQVLNSNSMTQ